MGVMLQVIMLVLVLSVTACADTYRWVDERGVVHFTDDPAAVPKRFEQKVRIIPDGDAASSVQMNPAKESAAVPAAPAAPVRTYGGRDETWWKSRYAGLRSELKELQAALQAKQAELEHAKRMYTLYSYTRNRIAYQDKEAEVRQLEERIATLNGELAAIDLDAARAGVPFEWRQ